MCWKIRELGKGTDGYLNQRCHRHIVSPEDLEFSSDNARKPLSNSGTTAPVKQYHSIPSHQLICLTSKAPGEQGGCLKDSWWGQRKVCEVPQKCHSTTQEDKSDTDVLDRIMLTAVLSLVLSGHCWIVPELSSPLASKKCKHYSQHLSWQRLKCVVAGWSAQTTTSSGQNRTRIVAWLQGLPRTWPVLVH